MSDYIKKGLFRFRQFGGWRLLCAYSKEGVLPTLVKAVAIVVLHRRPLKEVHTAVSERIEPVLQERYKPLVTQLARKYNDVKSEHEKSDVVWFCWLQGLEHAPALVKVCLSSLKRHLKGKRFVVITSANYHDYVTFPGYIESQYKKGIIPDSHFTDLLRMELLINHGGTWIDSTVLCTSGEYSEKMMDCNLFMFQYRKTKEDGFEGISNWFISAYSNNHILMILRDMLLQYWRDYDCLMDYFVFHLFFYMIAERFPDEIEAMPKKNSMRAIQLGQWLERAYDDRMMTQLTSLSCFHKLDYRKTKLLTKDGEPTFLSHILKRYA